MGLLLKVAQIILVIGLTAVCAALPGGLSGPAYAPSFSLQQYFVTIEQSLGGLVHGSLGATRYGGAAAEWAWTYFTRSMSIMLLGVAVAIVLGLLISLTRAGRRGAVRVGLAALLATPDFLLVMLLQLGLIFLARRGLPTPGYMAGAGHYVMPALVLSLFPAAYFAQLFTGAIDSVSRQDFIRTAVAKGCSPRRTLLRHVARSALSQVLPALPGLWALTISNLIMIEYLFVHPGAGYNLVTAMTDPRYADPQLATGLALLFALSYVVVDALTAFVVPLVDPRVRRRVES